MTKFYKFVAEQLVEAADQAEAWERFAYDSYDLAAKAKCYEACPCCLALIGAAVRICTCQATPTQAKVG